MSGAIKKLRNATIPVILIVSVSLGQTGEKHKPVPRLNKLDMKATDYQHVLGGSGESSTMRSGFVTLAPGKSVGRHNTETYEELIVVLEGRGTMVITGGDTLALELWDAAYCPSHTEHDVKNTGSDTLRYIYIVAKAEKE